MIIKKCIRGAVVTAAEADIEIYGKKGSVKDKNPREEAVAIVRKLREAGHEAFFVGGSVRDLARGLDPEEFDIVTSARPEEIKRLFPKTVPVGESFGITLVVRDGKKYEIATYRTDAGYGDGRHPSRVEFSSRAEEDVLRRDFTINGLLMDPESGRIIDHVGGLDDLRRKIVRTIGNPGERFSEDHLRMLRAVRFAANLNFALDDQTFLAIVAHSGRIRRVSAERTREEITRILQGGHARRGLELLAETGLLTHILPEVDEMRGVDQPERFHPEGDVWEHTLRMLAMLSVEPQLRSDVRFAWGTLLHDVGKPATRSVNSGGIHFYGHPRKGEKIAANILDRLRFSRADAETILSLIREHMLFMNAMEMRPSRLKRFLRIPDFKLHLELHRLDCLASHGDLETYEFCRAKLEEYASEQLKPERLIGGGDLIAMGYRPGPLFSEIIRVAEDAQLDGEISTKEEAIKFVRERWPL
ncbi:MAG: CCA tRNA nucleotidyltransferase [Syntrophales bacterium]|nr:CCA tRNA nucleotidyltransferase [Syntrophales bacterium]